MKISPPIYAVLAIFVLISTSIFIFILVSRTFQNPSISQSISTNKKQANSSLNQVNQKPSTKFTSLVYSNLELAKTDLEHQQGLMNRQSLCDDCGMVFVFEKVQPLSFWMKNTPLSLDMIFVDENGQIVTIHENTKPQSETLYPSQKPVKYVFEFKAGYAKKQDLKVGQTLNILGILDKTSSFGKT